MTSCHVSEKWKTGPSIAQTTIVAAAHPNAVELPVHAVTAADSASSLIATPLSGFRIGPPGKCEAIAIPTSWLLQETVGRDGQQSRNERGCSEAERTDGVVEKPPQNRLSGRI